MNDKKKKQLKIAILAIILAFLSFWIYFYTYIEPKGAWTMGLLILFFLIFWGLIRSFQQLKVDKSNIRDNRSDDIAESRDRGAY